MTDAQNKAITNLFFEKIKLGLVKDIQDLLKEDLDLNYKTSCNIVNCSLGSKNEIFPLLVASHEGHVDIVKLLLKNGADVNQRNDIGENSLFVAAQQGHADVVHTLLKHGACLTYTLKSANAQSKGLYENWEVFTQALKKAYPQNINGPKNEKYRRIAQILIDHTFQKDLTNCLYESLFCSLTIFGNPLALYAVGTYSMLCPDLAFAFFSDENFLRALCRAYKPTKAVDFVNTVNVLLHLNKGRQKEIARSLQAFSWSQILKEQSENVIRVPRSSEESYKNSISCVRSLMKVLHIFSAHFEIRVDFQSKLFRELETESIGKIGSMIKAIIENAEFDDGFTLSSEYTDITNSTWQFLFFLLKSLLRMKRNTWVSKLLLKEKRSGDSNPQTSEFESKILLRSLEDTPDLAHMLLDYGVTPSGECFAMAIQLGHIDIVNRLKKDERYLFSEDVSKVVMMANGSTQNRNKRKCIKAVKSAKNKAEALRKTSEMELMNMIEQENTPSEKKKTKRKRKQRINSNNDSSNESSLKADEKQNGDKGEVTGKKMNGSAIDGSKQSKSESEVLSSDNDVHTGKRRNQRRKKKNNKNQKTQQKDKKQIDDVTPELPTYNDKQQQFNNFNNTHREWDFVPRRRRQSSSSSEFSTASHGKNVHFSNRLVEYNTDTSAPRGRPHNAPDKTISILKKFEGNTTIRTNNNLSDINENMQCGDQLQIEQQDCGPLLWTPLSRRWNARFEYLAETEVEKLKELGSVQSQFPMVVYNDVERHLCVGNGPDFSTVYFCLTKQGNEAIVKKINTKRVHTLYNDEVVGNLTSMKQHDKLLHYHAVYKEKNHFYLVRSVGEVSLEQQMHLKKQSKEELETKKICREITEALSALHQQDILHMALKPSNVMFSHDGTIRLCDFGVHARKVTRVNNASTSAQCWLPIEIHAQKEPDKSVEYDTAVDMACLGMLLYYVLTDGGHPFGDPDSAPTVCCANILRGAFNLKALTDPFSHHLVRKLLQKEPADRFTINQAINHPFFWSSESCDEYVQLLAHVYNNGLANDQAQEVCSELLRAVDDSNHGIVNSYSNHDNFTGDADTADDLLKLMWKCILNRQQLEEVVTSLEEDVTASRFFWKNFPGTILHLYDNFPASQLHEMKNKLKNIKVIEAAHVILTSEHDAEKIAEELEEAVNEKSEDDVSEMLLDDEEEDVVVQTSDVEKEAAIFINSEDIQQQKPFTSQSDDSESSPDDWIDVGSPLATDTGSMPINCADHSCISPASNSASSVDDCFDFDSYFDHNVKSSIDEFTNMFELD